MRSIIRLFITMVILLVSCQMFAQNANRNGIFLELGAGYSIGNTPMKYASFSDGILHCEYTTAPGMYFDGGWRQAISAQSAIEGKIQFQFNFKNAGPTTLVKIMPGYKFFFRNKPLKNIYVGANAGLAIGSSVVFEKFSSISDKYEGLYPCKAFDPLRLGLAYTAEIGFTFSKKAYTSLSWEAQILKQGSPKGYALRNWGMVGLKIGYNFNIEKINVSI